MAVCRLFPRAASLSASKIAHNTQGGRGYGVPQKALSSDELKEFHKLVKFFLLLYIESMSLIALALDDGRRIFCYVGQRARSVGYTYGRATVKVGCKAAPSSVSSLDGLTQKIDFYLELVAKGVRPLISCHSPWNIPRHCRLHPALGLSAKGADPASSCHPPCSRNTRDGIELTQTQPRVFQHGTRYR